MCVRSVITIFFKQFDFFLSTTIRGFSVRIKKMRSIMCNLKKSQKLLIYYIFCAFFFLFCTIKTVDAFSIFYDLKLKTRQYSLIEYVD